MLSIDFQEHPEVNDSSITSVEDAIDGVKIFDSHCTEKQTSVLH